MATEEQKTAIARRFIEVVHVGERQTAEVDMDDLKAAAGDAFDWADTNQTGFNTALPDPFKTVATTKQKAQLLSFALEALVRAS